MPASRPSSPSVDRPLSRRLGSKQQRANSQPDRQRHVCGSAKSKQETLAGAARIDRRPKLAESSRLPLTASPPSSWLPFRRPASGLHLQASPASSALPLARCSFALTAPPSLLFSPLSNLSSLPLVPFLPKHANNHARTPTQKERTADPPVPKNSWSVIIGLVIIVAFSGVSWFASPKGENQT